MKIHAKQPLLRQTCAAKKATGEAKRLGFHHFYSTDTSSLICCNHGIATQLSILQDGGPIGTQFPYQCMPARCSSSSGGDKKESIETWDSPSVSPKKNDVFGPDRLKNAISVCSEKKSMRWIRLRRRRTEMLKFRNRTSQSHLFTS